jgi:hypothetical protein
MYTVSLLAGIAQFKMITLQDHARLPDFANHRETPQLQNAPKPVMKSTTAPIREFNFSEQKFTVTGLSRNN